MEKEKDPQCRKWQLTINNPADYGIDDDVLAVAIDSLKYEYACYCHEIGENGTPHIHIYIYSKSAKKFSTLKKLLPSAHLEKAKGTHQQNRDYILKEGKWADTEKKETNLPDTFREFGELPPDRPTKKDKKELLYDMIKSGMSNSEIIKEDKSYIYQIRHMDEVRQAIIEAEYADKNRDIEVIYLHGASGAGKTSSIYARHPAKDICRITSYRKNGQVYFDAYNGQDVLVFEEFSGQIPITEMLNYLDIYPLKLPARYMDKQACYTKVYITSNRPIEQIYAIERMTSPETYNAFLRRINRIITFEDDGNMIVRDLDEEREQNETKH